MSEASKRIDQDIASFPDWRGETYKELRRVINEADPELTEEWKWNTAVWSKNGLVCAVAAFKNHVKVNVFRGAALDDPHQLFNAGLDAKTMRSIDFHEGDKINEPALKELVRAAVAQNQSR